MVVGVGDGEDEAGAGGDVDTIRREGHAVDVDVEGGGAAGVEWSRAAIVACGRAQRAERHHECHENGDDGPSQAVGGLPFFIHGPDRNKYGLE